MSVVVIATVALIAGCASAPSTQPAYIEKAETQPAETPFLFTEADPPAGFPPPGPIDRVITKEYPAYRLARISAQSMLVDGKPDASGMFMALYKHVQNKRVSMTTPVEATYDMPAPSPSVPPPSTSDGEAAPPKKSRPVAMAAIYPNPSIGSVGVDPVDPRITVADVPASTSISIAFRGEYNSKTFTAAIARLLAAVADSRGELTVIGPPRYLAYNSPFVPAFARVGEVQLPVRRAQNNPPTRPGL